MTTDCDASTLRKHPQRRMPTTRTGVVRMAQQGDTPAEAHAALRQLCELYWQPVLVFIRYRLGRHPSGADDARDLAQAFMADLLTRGIRTYDPVHLGRRARFRSWLLGAVKYFLSKQLQQNYLKQMQSWDALSPHQRALSEPRIAMSAERMFTITFAAALGDQAWNTTRAWYAARGQEARFDLLERFIPGDEIADLDYESVAAALGESRECVRQAVRQLRVRYRLNLRRHIRTTVPRDSEVDGEFALLFGEDPNSNQTDDGA